MTRDAQLVWARRASTLVVAGGLFGGCWVAETGLLATVLIVGAVGAAVLLGMLVMAQTVIERTAPAPEEASSGPLTAPLPRYRPDPVPEPPSAAHSPAERLAAQPCTPDACCDAGHPCDRHAPLHDGSAMWNGGRDDLDGGRHV